MQCYWYYIGKFFSTDTDIKWLKWWLFLSSPNKRLHIRSDITSASSMQSTNRQTNKPLPNMLTFSCWRSLMLDSETKSILSNYQTHAFRPQTKKLYRIDADNSIGNIVYRRRLGHQSPLKYKYQMENVIKNKHWLHSYLQRSTWSTCEWWWWWWWSWYFLGRDGSSLEKA